MLASLPQPYLKVSTSNLAQRLAMFPQGKQRQAEVHLMSIVDVVAQILIMPIVSQVAQD